MDLLGHKKRFIIILETILTSEPTQTGQQEKPKKNVTIEAYLKPRWVLASPNRSLKLFVCFGQLTYHVLEGKMTRKPGLYIYCDNINISRYLRIFV